MPAKKSKTSKKGQKYGRLGIDYEMIPMGGLGAQDGLATARTRFYESEFDTNESETGESSSSEVMDWRRDTWDFLMGPEYPRAVAYIISNEFCERFNYYGMRAILVLYLTNKMDYDEEAATILFHIFTMLVYICPLIGAIIADGWLGKYKTILNLSIVYSVGACIVAIGAIPMWGMPVTWVTVIGLMLIALGTGGIKPCVSAFGGDQFIMPAQAVHLARFFSFFYFAINAGSMISTTVTPILRADVSCFGEDDCYFLAFGIPAMLMVASVIIFVCGRRHYTCNSPSGHMIFGVTQCLRSAFVGWLLHRRRHPHWKFLDHAEPVVGKQIVEETKSLTKILILYLPFPLFWALSDQQGSRWTFQATHMDGSFFGSTIKPDQMQVINPLLILAFIPLFDYKVYPTLFRYGIKRPLQKLTIGLLMASLGFFLAAAVELHLELVQPEAAPSSPDMAHLRLYNGLACRYDFTCKDLLGPDSHTIEPLGMWSNLDLYAPLPAEYEFKAEPQLSTNIKAKCPIIEGRIRLEPGEAVSYFLTRYGYEIFADGDNRMHRSNRPPLVRTLFNTPTGEGPIVLRTSGERSMPAIQIDSGNYSALHEVTIGRGEIHINGKRAATFHPKRGGLYSLLVQGNAFDGYKYNMIEIVAQTSVSILWQLPQIVVMTAAEIMFSVTGLEFSFTEAPTSMKSVLQACWLLCVAIGNMLVVVIAEIKFVSSQSAEFALFATMMLVNVLFFLVLARNYDYIHLSQIQQDEEAEAGKFDKEKHIVYEENIKRIVGYALEETAANRNKNYESNSDSTNAELAQYFKGVDDSYANPKKKKKKKKKSSKRR